MTPASTNLQCPDCNETQRVSWDFKTDEVTCFKCGLVSCIGNFVIEHKPAVEVNTVSFRPLHDQILIKPADPELKSAGGLHIPDSAQRQEGSLFRGKVLAIGKGERNKRGERVPLQTRPGDEVLFYRNPSTEIDVDGIQQKCTVIHEEQYAVAVLEP